MSAQTLSINCTGATSIHVAFTVYNANAYVPKYNGTNMNCSAGVIDASVYTFDCYLEGITGGASDVVSTPTCAAACYPSLYVLGFSGEIASSGIDGSPGTLTPWPNTFGLTTTPSASNELAIICLNWISGTTTPSVDSSFVAGPVAITTGGTSYGGGIFYKIKTDALGERPTILGAGDAGAASLQFYKHS
jgi:hypothetical protein